MAHFLVFLFWTLSNLATPQGYCTKQLPHTHSDLLADRTLSISHRKTRCSVTRPISHHKQLTTNAPLQCVSRIRRSTNSQILFYCCWSAVKHIRTDVRDTRTTLCEYSWAFICAINSPCAYNETKRRVFVYIINENEWVEVRWAESEWVSERDTHGD